MSIEQKLEHLKEYMDLYIENRIYRLKHFSGNTNGYTTMDWLLHGGFQMYLAKKTMYYKVDKMTIEQRNA